MKTKRGPRMRFLNYSLAIAAALLLAAFIDANPAYGQC